VELALGRQLAAGRSGPIVDLASCTSASWEERERPAVGSSAMVRASSPPCRASMPAGVPKPTASSEVGVVVVTDDGDIPEQDRPESGQLQRIAAIEDP
jgi:hypothetical protein